jgi:hypothetical protein
MQAHAVPSAGAKAERAAPLRIDNMIGTRPRRRRQILLIWRKKKEYLRRALDTGCTYAGG